MIFWDLDWREPICAFAPLAGQAHAHLLHGGDRSSTAEWSIIAAFPAAVIRADRNDPDPFLTLDAALHERRIESDGPLRRAPFMSGALGFVGYEAGRFFEPGLDLPPSPYALPDVALGLYDSAALFSRTSRQAYIVGRSEAGCRRLRDALGSAPHDVRAPEMILRLASNFTPARYRSAVAQAIENILDGDYYQANLSQQLTARAASTIAAFDLFTRLARESDAFHSAYLQYEEGAIVSNSPERFFRIEAGAYGGERIIVEPIKGTRPRHHDENEDARLARILASDPKDRAENIMIADLLRNDLSRICRDGTIREEAICAPMTLASVHHLVSRISGVLNDDATPSAIFAALFPCGSVTGAPKIAAMEAIAEIEQVGRGPYCGAIGYFDDRGGADFSVGIRTLMIEGATVTIPVGGGVTLRSNPQEEYDETLIKARSALAALGRSPDGLDGGPA